MAELISVIVTTYNRDDALAAVLRSLAHQTDPDFEVIVADDGSGQATAALVESWKARIGHRVVHVWHEDKGFRAAEIRNRAILARAALCVFLDGDCIVRRILSLRTGASRSGLVRIRQPRPALVGTDGDSVARRLDAGNWPLARWLAERVRGGVNRIAALLPLPLGPLRRLRRGPGRARARAISRSGAPISTASTASTPTTGAGARRTATSSCGCCMRGLKRKDGNFATGVIHLWHKEADRGRLPRTRAARGVSAATACARGAASRR